MVAALAVVSLLPAYFCWILSGCSAKVGIYTYLLMIFLPILCLEIHLAPEEFRFRAQVEAEPELFHEMNRAEPNAWCSFSYTPYGEIIVID